jgi:L-ascorbate metabolism protein UlaG (beta-lactamase superfamily)
MVELARGGGLRDGSRSGGGRNGGNDGPDLIPLSRNGFPAAEDALTWVGHASYVIRMAGMCVLADPVWCQKLNGVARRLTPPGVAWSELPRIDAVLLSHNHYDHMDWATLRRLPRDTPMLVPGGLGKWFRRKDFTRVSELDWWESATLGPLKFDFVPSHHWSRRGAFDACRSLWGGWVITSERTRVFHAGDSGYGHWFREIGERYPNVDVAMLPIGAYDPRWFMSPVHMNPEESVRALADLDAKRLAHMHWGTFTLTTEPVMEPLHRLRKAWADSGRPREDLWDLAIGETRALDF